MPRQSFKQAQSGEQQVARAGFSKSICFSMLIILSSPAGASADEQQAHEQHSHKRPALKSDRWQEDWSPLADAALRTQPFDTLKYIALSPLDPQNYISFGANLRERFESNDAPGFGTVQKSDSYLLQRFQFHVDVHLFDTWQIFTQFEDVRAFGKKIIGPADENQLDLRLAFLGYKHEFDSGTFMTRIGRQEIAFDLQRFVSSREGPNVRQAFDAVWAEWDATPWRFKGFISQPVQYHDDEPFDDESNGNIRFSAFRVEHDYANDVGMSAYYAYYARENAIFLDAAGDEERHGFDARLSGREGLLDWDVEAMGQLGTVGAKDIRAWAVGARVGYTFDDMAWQPRFGLQFDAASGDSRAGDDTIGTFNGLFANGSYFSLAGYTTYANLVHLKPSITLKPTEVITLMGAAGLQWRQTTADAVYTAPNIPVAGTGGRGGSWTGYYTQLRLDYAINANMSAAAEYVHFQAGEAIRKAGGHSTDYLGAELKFAW